MCQQCMEEVGKKFEAGDYFLPELVMAGEIFKQVSFSIKPYFKDGDGQKHLGTIVIGTPKGDIHALGKDIFCVLAEAAGFRTASITWEKTSALRVLSTS